MDISSYERQLRGLLQAQHQPEDVIATALSILAKAARDAHQDGRTEATQWYENQLRDPR